MQDMLLIMNFDDDNSRSVARKLRAERFYCKIVPGNLPLQEALKEHPMGLLLVGGEKGAVPHLDPELTGVSMPVIATGGAAAALCAALGGSALEIALNGSVETVHFQQSPLTQGLEQCDRMLRSVRRLTLPDTLRVLATAHNETVAFTHAKKPIFGLQFSMEQNDPDGMLLLVNFARVLCGCTPWWDIEAFVKRAEEDITRASDGAHAACALTGGLNSGISAVLAHRALGDRLHCLFVDTGLLRDNEGNDFMTFYHDKLGLDVRRVFAQDRFIGALRGIQDACEKRLAVIRTMQAVLDEHAEEFSACDVLIRGISCNDVMSGENPEDRPSIRGPKRTVEPVRELFKDEIRRVGDYLNMPGEVISRQPFPGSGLALRIMGEVTPARLQTLRAADAIFTEEVRQSGQSKRLWQYFAVLSGLPGADSGLAVALRAVQTGEGSSVYAARLPYDLLERTAERILRERPEVRRILYDLTPSSNFTDIEKP